MPARIDPVPCVLGYLQANVPNGVTVAVEKEYQDTVTVSASYSGARFVQLDVIGTDEDGLNLAATMIDAKFRARYPQ